MYVPIKALLCHLYQSPVQLAVHNVYVCETTCRNYNNAQKIEGHMCWVSEAETSHINSDDGSDT